MDWNTFAICWWATAFFINCMDMRWQYWRMPRFYVYFISNLGIMVAIWPFFVAKWITHYKRTVPTRLYN